LPDGDFQLDQTWPSYITSYPADFGKEVVATDVWEEISKLPSREAKPKWAEACRSTVTPMA
jgi:hypothetical protein